jgi:hypothetical protein
MIKRQYLDLLTASDVASDSATVASDIALTLIEDVLESIKQTTGWKKMKMAAADMILKLEDYEMQKQALKHPRPGGSKPGRKIIQRNFVLAFETLRMQYFSQHPVYSDVHFKRRFRFSKEIFGRIYQACSMHPFFRHKQNAAGKWSIHPLVKITAVLRQV